MRRLTLLVLLLPAAAGALITTAQASSGRVYLNVQGYGARPVVKYEPAHLNRITGDGTAFVDRISWTRWGQKDAYATGRAHLNNCEPSCAEGRFATTSTHLHAYRIRYCPAADRDVYTRLTIRGIHVGGTPAIAINHDCDPGD